MNTRGRILTATAAAVVLAGAGGAYALSAADGDRVVAASAEAPSRGADQLYYRAPNGRVAAVAMTGSVPADGGARPADTALRCVRFAAAGPTRVCLTPGAGPLDPGAAVVLDGTLKQVRRIALAGAPSRAQVSPSGRMVSWTVFVSGETYGDGTFATWTSILDTVTGEYVANIESIPLLVGGRRHHAADLNFWGVTFARDDDRFYATAASGGRTYLVAARMGEWEARAVGTGVECPSLSPDGTRLAFKKRVGPGLWRLAVLTLADGRETMLGELQSVDDQAVWLDDRTVAYGRPRPGGGSDIWAVAADGRGAPILLVPGGSSPVRLWR